MELHLRLADAADVPSIAALEAASYPADEAATPQRIAYRVANAQAYFLLLEDGHGTLMGFVNGTCVSGTLTEETMASHDANGDSLCIHSVVIAEKLRRKGLALWLLGRYVCHVATTQPHIQRLLLLAHDDKASLYARAGFVSKGPSAVVHGSLVWLDMERPITAQDRGAIFIRANAFVVASEQGGLKPFTGGPAGVVILPGCPLSSLIGAITERKDTAAALAAVDVKDAGVLGFPSAAWMQSLAAELNISTTAFVVPLPAYGCRHWAIRWFTPTTELPLCGHATLAAAHALWTQGTVYLPHSSHSDDGAALPFACDLVFHSLSGRLVASASTTGANNDPLSGPAIEMIFPPDPPAPSADVETAHMLLASPSPSSSSQGRCVLASCLGLQDSDVTPVGSLAAAMNAHTTASNGDSGSSSGVLMVTRTGSGTDITVEVTADVFARMAPNTRVMQALLAPATRILTITTSGAGWRQLNLQQQDDATAAASSSTDTTGPDFVSRVFFPRTAFEDPVCGAAHVQLASYWAQQQQQQQRGAGVLETPEDKAMGLRRMRAYQASPRGGEVTLAVRAGAARAATSVRLGGRCLTTLVGQLTCRQEEEEGRA